MKNLEQIRAKNALAATGSTSYAAPQGGEVAKKIPTMIRENGLLATMAFAVEKKKNGDANPGHKAVLHAVLIHLQDPEIKLVKADVDQVEDWLADLSVRASSLELREQTAEAMSYLNYFRRFASKDGADHANHRNS